MDSLYSRQESLALTIPRSAIVVGLGGTGSHMAWLLAMSGVPTLALFDYDTLEESNLNRVPLPREYLGLPKAEAMGRWLKALRPELALTIEGRASSWSLGTVEGEVLFDCTDRWHTQEELSKYCKEDKIKYIRVGYNGGTHITMSEFHGGFLTGTPPTGYEIVPSWVGCAIMPALLALFKVMAYPDLDVSLDLKELPQRLGQIKPTAVPTLYCDELPKESYITLEEVR
jgi:hypothetical protein